MYVQGAQGKETKGLQGFREIKKRLDKACYRN